MTRTRPPRGLLWPVVLLSACSSAPADVEPLVGPPTAATTPELSAWSDRAAGSTAPADAVEAVTGPDPAVAALATYLREQALAVNAGTADPEAVPAFTASVTVAARDWALPLLAANLGDRMPGPYPVGVLAGERRGDDVAVLSICLQDRGWQVDRDTGRPLGPEHFGTATATVRRVGDRWLVDDVVADGGACAAGDVVREVF